MSLGCNGTAGARTDACVTTPDCQPPAPLNVPWVTPYFLVTTPQRCGSHMMTNLLNVGAGGQILSGGESALLKVRIPTFASFLCRLRRQLELEHSRHASVPPVISGFISHANGIGAYADQFARWTRDYGKVKVLDGRRAAVMAISDGYLANAANAQLGGHVSNPLADASIHETYFNLTAHNRLPVTEALAEAIRQYEGYAYRSVEEVQRITGGRPPRGSGGTLFTPTASAWLRASGLLYRYNYEDLIIADSREEHLGAIFKFLLGANSSVARAMAAEAFRFTDAQAASTGQTILTLHPPTCSSRVTDWAALRPMINGTYTQRACDRLEREFGKGGRRLARVYDA